MASNVDTIAKATRDPAAGGRALGKMARYEFLIFVSAS